MQGGQLGGTIEHIAIDDRFKSLSGVSLGWNDEPQPSVPMAFSMNAMVDAIKGGKNAAPNFAQALEVERIQEAIRLSSLERRWVTVSDVV